MPKKHSLITQKQFWPFFGVFSGFLGVPQTLNFGGLSLYFDNSLRKNGQKSRDPTRRLVGTKVNLDNPYTFAILKLFGKFLVPQIHLNPLKNA